MIRSTNPAVERVLPPCAGEGVSLASLTARLTLPPHRRTFHMLPFPPFRHRPSLSAALAATLLIATAAGCAAERTDENATVAVASAGVVPGLPRDR